MTPGAGGPSLHPAGGGWGHGACRWLAELWAFFFHHHPAAGGSASAGAGRRLCPARRRPPLIPSQHQGASATSTRGRQAVLQGPPSPPRPGFTVGGRGSSAVGLEGRREPQDCGSSFGWLSTHAPLCHAVLIRSLPSHGTPVARGRVGLAGGRNQGIPISGGAQGGLELLATHPPGYGGRPSVRHRGSFGRPPGAADAPGHRVWGPSRGPGVPGTRHQRQRPPLGHPWPLGQGRVWRTSRAPNAPPPGLQDWPWRPPQAGCPLGERPTRWFRIWPGPSGKAPALGPPCRRASPAGAPQRPAQRGGAPHGGRGSLFPAGEPGATERMTVQIRQGWGDRDDHGSSTGATEIFVPLLSIMAALRELVV
ncbi:collagen alpha-1(I) chain-like [Sphaerodactylus townsendi]|uniref:collagen alpha-1(I) chain-like n=1 Tax=Sphaerodactylus townsendi TaxID=933632 RepID=UPI0020263495|nr:collagen alpha-1(I) chain-like [Sphaerodactylus townsendi]XP_048357099.1 collagen alpha-1(I) chain-like [Sphaerodactylus townsendi]XP_048357100.1 collagen alpha-1(I) chain-like [Sphaerodactylus townsendi]XP_048357101.1 collagen alpha-1(I) chain-like [Sphaerodactylus townsendi]